MQSNSDRAGRVRARRRNGIVAAVAVAVLAGGGYWWFASQRGGTSGEPGAPGAPGVTAQQEYAVGETLARKAPADGGPAAAGPFREIEWDALVPKGWDPAAPLKGLDLAQMQDDDPRAQEALALAKRYWQEAPVEPAMDGARVRLPGFVVSLGGEGEAIREFLLVPYFGACIHVPPPPANQVVHVQAGAALEGTRTMDPVWIEGTLQVQRAQTPMGDSGYVMRAARVTPYVETPR
ncbi:DUF3299 domain-containing protein [Paracidovorax citrulli]